MIEIGDWILTACGAAVHRECETAVVADLHLGYAESRQQRGDAVPTRDLSTTLLPIQSLMQSLSLTRLVIAGDLFQQGPIESILSSLESWLSQNQFTITIIPGNHDRGMSRFADRFDVQSEMMLGEWHVVHGDDEIPEGLVVQGHLHPCIRWRGLSGSCFLMSEQHLILPALAPDASGVNVIGRREWSGYRCLALVEGELLDFGTKLFDHCQ